jgi:hypothetical protein
MPHSTLSDLQDQLGRAEAVFAAASSAASEAETGWRDLRGLIGASREDSQRAEAKHEATKRPLEAARRALDEARARHAAAVASKSQLATLDRADGQALADAEDVFAALVTALDGPVRTAVAKAAASAQASLEAFSALDSETRRILGQNPVGNPWASLVRASPAHLGTVIPNVAKPPYGKDSAGAFIQRSVPMDEWTHREWIKRAMSGGA